MGRVGRFNEECVRFVKRGVHTIDQQMSDHQAAKINKRILMAESKEASLGSSIMGYFPAPTAVIGSPKCKSQ